MVSYGINRLYRNLKISPCKHGLIKKKPWSHHAIYSVSAPQWNHGYSKFEHVKYLTVGPKMYKLTTHYVIDRNMPILIFIIKNFKKQI